MENSFAITRSFPPYGLKLVHDRSRDGVPMPRIG
jgi:hypothetical protein